MLETKPNELKQTMKPKGWFRRCLLRVGILIIVGVPTLIEFRFCRPPGNGPAGPEVASQPFDDTWTPRRVHLLGVGDSITRGLGADRPSHSFFNRLLANPEDEWDDMKERSLSKVLPNLTSANFAISGSTSIDHARVIAEEIPRHEEGLFGLVVMTSGGNDLIHPYGRRPPSEGAMYGATMEQAKPWIENFGDRLASNLTGIESKFPGGCLIFLADIYDPTDGVGDAPSVFLPPWPDGLAILAAYNETIRNTANRFENVHLVSLHETFLGHGAHCRQFWRRHYRSDDPHYWFFTNIEDPNDRGYDAIRRVFLNTMIKQRDKI